MPCFDSNRRRTGATDNFVCYCNDCTSKFQDSMDRKKASDDCVSNKIIFTTSAPDFLCRNNDDCICEKCFPSAHIKSKHNKKA